ncbi:MAG: aminodeoxychorismate/anthranilate synthase component II [Planctomycetota bacterium]|nr:MAG: aminodeoxychorismate/anthranilate synthase component II [Planctomycetota bacterium]
MILIVDNYDSFTWNLVQRIGELDHTLEVRVERNDQVSLQEIESHGPSHIILSPGPCDPAKAGISREVVRHCAGKVPLLGVCLGHQCIGDVFGMRVQRHPLVMHGKTSPIHHDGQGVHAGVDNPFTATRYHSLVVARESVPAQGWAVSAWTRDTLDDGTTVEVVMGLRKVWSEADRAAGLCAPLEGVQYHPESFLTDAGYRILANFLELQPTTDRAFGGRDHALAR